MKNKDVQFLKELQDELRTQENDGQAAPRFWVIMDYEWQVTAEGYHDRVMICDPEIGETLEAKEYVSWVFDNLSDLALTEKDIKTLKEDVSSGKYSEADIIAWAEDRWCDVFYEKSVPVIQPNTMFLTKQEAKYHLEANSHHYSDKAHTYAMTALRAPKVERLLKILETFDWDKVVIK